MPRLCHAWALLQAPRSSMASLSRARPAGLTFDLCHFFIIWYRAGKKHHFLPYLVALFAQINPKDLPQLFVFNCDYQLKLTFRASLINFSFNNYILFFNIYARGRSGPHMLGSIETQHECGSHSTEWDPKGFSVISSRESRHTEKWLRVLSSRCKVKIQYKYCRMN